MLIAHDYNRPDREVVTGTNQLLICSDAYLSLKQYLNSCYFLFVDNWLAINPDENARLEELQSGAQAVIHCHGEPKALDVLEVARNLIVNAERVSFVAIGGGSTIDFTKGVFSYFQCGEIYCRDINIRQIDAAIIAVPTTVGSGSEVSRFAVIADEKGRKQTARSWDLRPELTILDAQFLKQVPSLVLLTWAFDAFNHLLEASINRFEKTRFFRPIIVEGMTKIIDAVKYWQLTGASTLPLTLIEGLQFASVYAGSVISNVRTNLLHALAEPYSEFSHLTHPQTLVLFYRQAYGFLSKEIDQFLIDMRFQENGLGDTQALTSFWEFLEVHHHQAIQEDLLRSVHNDNLCKKLSRLVLRDKVLVEKECPRNIDENRISQIVKTAFGHYLNFKVSKTYCLNKA